MSEICTWCFHSVGTKPGRAGGFWRDSSERPVTRVDEDGDTLHFCNHHCLSEWRIEHRGQQEGSPPAPKDRWKPEIGMYGEFDVREWCWDGANARSLLGLKPSLTVEGPLEDLHFCDEECLALYRQHSQKSRVDLRVASDALQNLREGVITGKAKSE